MSTVQRIAEGAVATPPMSSRVAHHGSTSGNGHLLMRGAMLIAGIGLLYGVHGRLAEVLSSAEGLRDIEPGWFVVMCGFEIMSFASMWGLMRQVLPGVSWFVTATSQLVSNSVSRIVPGGAAAGGAALYGMLSVSGVPAGRVASAMAATSVLSYGFLFAVPALAGLSALLGAPVPAQLLPATFTGTALFVVLLSLGCLLANLDGPLLLVGRIARRPVERVGRAVGQTWSVDGAHLVAEREQLMAVLDHRWAKAMMAAAGNWLFDYLALVAALWAVGAEPALSLVALAYVAAAVLAMVPLTPGGAGIVEVGLYSTLVVSGIPGREAAVATIAYRAVSWWFPVAGGLVAWLAFRLRFRGPFRFGSESGGAS